VYACVCVWLMYSTLRGFKNVYGMRPELFFKIVYLMFKQRAQTNTHCESSCRHILWTIAKEKLIQTLLDAIQATKERKRQTQME